MINHFCPIERTMIAFEDKCNWCGREEKMMTKDEALEPAKTSAKTGEKHMKLEFDIDDNNMLLDIMGGVFIALLQRELKESKEALPKFKHPEDVKMYKRNIKACKQLLDYYGGLDGTA